MKEKLQDVISNIRPQDERDQYTETAHSIIENLVKNTLAVQRDEHSQAWKNVADRKPDSGEKR